MAFVQDGDGRDPLAPLLALEPAAVRCPHHAFAASRDEAPVRWEEELGCFVATRHEDVHAIARDAARFSNRMPTGARAAARTFEVMAEVLEASEELRAIAAGAPPMGAAVLLLADPPEHDRQRALVSRAFTPRRVRLLEDEIAAVADDLVGRFADRGEVELVAALAVPLPLTVIARALGVGDGDLPTFRRWSDAFTATIGNHHLQREDLDLLLRGQAEFAAHFQRELEARRQAPRDDLISDLVQARIDGERPLTDAEVLGMLNQFLVAGNETTAKLIASAALLLAERPALLAQVTDDPSLVPALVEEVLRLEAPVQGLFRVAVEDVEVGGTRIPAGSSVWAVYAAAGRDPERWPQPDELRLDRPDGRGHLAFGIGAHHCLGAALARAEAVLGLQRLLARTRGLRLADGANAPVAFEPSYVLHGPSELHLRFDPVEGSVSSPQGAAAGASA